MFAVAAAVGFQVWFVNNAKGVIRRFISEKSHEKLKVELSHVKFDYFSNRIQIHEAEIVSTDSVFQAITYHIKFKQLTLRVASVWPLLFKKRLVLDSIQLHEPEIEVLQWRRDTAQRMQKDELSLPQEMGKLYKSMLDALDEFGIRRIIISNAKISLFNKMKPGSEPVAISGINFDLLRKPRKNKNDTEPHGEQSVELSTKNQDIALPGGRHRLAFKTFNLQLFRQRIELDSCTVTATTTDSSRSSYKIFFKKLLLLGVDLNAMEKQNVIRADSVYCEDPFFDFDLYRSDARRKKTGVPDPDKILQELTGNLDLAFVGVHNAGIHIDINGKRKTSIFNSKKDDFKMEGLLVKPDSSEPVSIKRFDMTVRDYHLYNEDSSTIYKFDSLQFLDDKVMLNNFSVVTTPNKRRAKSYRNFSIPRFELTSLDWYELIFEQNLVAKSAFLKNPVIQYTRAPSGITAKRTNLFTSLQSLDNLMTLDRIIVENGIIKVKTGSATALDFNRVDLSISSNRLLRSKNKEGLQNAVDRLTFSDGTIRLKGITAYLENARYTGDKLVYAHRLNIKGKDDRINASIREVYLDNLQFDDDGDNIEIDGLGWASANIAVKSLFTNGNANKRRKIIIRNIAGNRTDFDFQADSASLSTYLYQVKANELLKDGDKPARFDGLKIEGKDMAFNLDNLNLRASAYRIADGEQSYLKNLRIDRQSGDDTLLLTTPSMTFATSIQQIPGDGFDFKNMVVTNPGILVHGTKSAVKHKGAGMPVIKIDNLTVANPVVDITSIAEGDTTNIRVAGGNGSVKGKQILLSGDTSGAKELMVNLSSILFKAPNGSSFVIDSGKVDLDLTDISVAKSEDQFSWRGTLNTIGLQSSTGLQFGKKNKGLHLNSVTAGGINLSSEQFGDIGSMLKQNPHAWVNIPAASFEDSLNRFHWYNAQYDQFAKRLQVDSFTYEPTRSLDSVLAQSTHRSDYLTLRTKAIMFTGFEASRLKQDSTVLADTITINNPEFTIYKDKKLPFLAGIIKPLPAVKVNNISFPLSIKNLRLVDGSLNYIEKDSSSGVEGKLRLTRLQGELINIRNKHTVANDSLGIHLEGHLMDTLQLDLTVKQSYTDSLAGSIIYLKAKDAPLGTLNEMLTPLSNIKITSGKLDSLWMRVIANDKVAIGNMTMYYDGLKIRMVKDGMPSETSFKNKLMNFVANTFILRKKGNERTSVVYFKRLRDRSFFNYLIKMTISGMGSGVGIKNSRKYLKQYRKEFGELPPTLNRAN